MKHSTDSKTEISAGARVRGTIRGGEDLLVRGRVEGAIDIEAELSVAPSGIVKANVAAKRVLVAGVLVGDVNATERIEIAPEGRLVGDISAPNVRISDGAKFSGSLSAGGEGVERKKSSTIAPRVEEWRSEEPEPRPVVRQVEKRPEEKRTTVTSFVPPKTPSDERRKKRVVIKKRR